MNLQNMFGPELLVMPGERRGHRLIADDSHKDAHKQARGRRRLSPARLISVIVLIGCAAGLVLHFVFAFSVSTVLSGSMRPTFRPGALIITRVESVRDLRVGKIIVYTPPGDQLPIAHRIAALTGAPRMPAIVTRGDANPKDDAAMTLQSGDVPVVLEAVPFAGRFVSAVNPRRPLTRTLFVLVIGLAFTYRAVRRTAKQFCPCGRCLRRRGVSPALAPMH
jgi:signal peptidase I